MPSWLWPGCSPILLLWPQHWVRDDSRTSDGLWEMEKGPGQGGKLVRAQWDDAVRTKGFSSPLDREAKLLFLRISLPPRK